MEKYKPLQYKAYEYLKEKILNGSFEYGKFYSESGVAAETGFSRTPIKDALTRLCHDKYIDIIPSKGFCLHIISAEDIRNSYQLRTAIEGFCASALAEKMGSKKAEKILMKMRKNLEDMYVAIQENVSLTEFVSIDMQFHGIMVDFAENTEFNDLAESYNHRQYEYALKTFEEDGRIQSAYEEHKVIYEKIAKGKFTEAYEALKNHMDKTCDISLKIMAMDDDEKNVY